MPREKQPHPYENSRELQRKLYLAAKRSRNRRFHALYDRIFRPDIMWQAWIEVRKNDGSAGVDGITLEDIEKSGVTKFLNQIQEELKSGTYHPQPVRRVYIEKSDGRQRPLGIPTVKDRVVQQACKIVIEPIFEANFQDCSFGFRPKRSGQEAVLAVKEALVRGWWVDFLISLLKRRISDRRVLKLLRQWLTARIMENGVKHIP
jgi:group II intron reverse transcriptase/maturase